MSSVRWCCFIPCDRAATWTAYWYDDKNVGDDTDACDEHLTTLIPHDREVNVTGLEVSAIDQLGKLADETG